jgi:excisionase family DNA binding protein
MQTLNITNARGRRYGINTEVVQRFLARIAQLSPAEWEAVASRAAAVPEASMIDAEAEAGEVAFGNMRGRAWLLATRDAYRVLDNLPASHPGAMAASEAAGALAVQHRLSSERLRALYQPFEPLIPLEALLSGEELAPAASPAVPDVSRYLSIESAARVLGVHRSTVFRYLKEGRLHRFRRGVGRQAWLDRQEVQALLVTQPEL